MRNSYYDDLPQQSSLCRHFWNPTFIFIGLVGYWSLKHQQELPWWVAMVLTIIGGLGVIVDGVFVLSTFVFG